MKSLSYVNMGVNCPFNGFESGELFELEYDGSVFPGGEVFVRLKEGSQQPRTDHVVICASIKSSDDLMKVLMMTDALRRVEFQYVSLYMPYVPYARQDRVCTPGESHSLRVFSDIINSQHYFEVCVFDPHSDITGAVFNNLAIISNHKFVLEAVTRLSLKSDDFYTNAVLVSPDAGALKKITGLAKYLHQNNFTMDVVQADKLRNMATTEITKIVVHSDDLGGKNCIIVDDICDGGRTFIDLAKALKEKNAGKIALVVSHGIFSKGLNVLSENIEHVIWSDSIGYTVPPGYIVEVVPSVIGIGQLMAPENGAFDRV